jgi:hypothetical protein
METVGSRTAAEEDNNKRRIKLGCICYYYIEKLLEFVPTFSKQDERSSFKERFLFWSKPYIKSIWKQVTS